MRARLCSSAEEFLARTSDYRALEPIRTNVMGSVAGNVVSDPDLYERHWWWIIEDGDRVVGAAIRTAPFGLNVGPMSDDAATLLAHEVSVADDGFPAVNGPAASVEALLGAYRDTRTTGARRAFRQRRTSLVYELTDLRAPRVPGTSRRALLADLDLIAEWNVLFHRFVDGNDGDDVDHRTMLKHKIDDGAFYLWCRGDEAVAMAGHAVPVVTPAGTVTRVGPVFTPEQLRGRGYGSAITAVVSAALLASGSRVMLYADAANPTSNAVYQKLGFELLGPTLEFDAI